MTSRSTAQATQPPSTQAFAAAIRRVMPAEPVRILVTGFGRFPGVPENPTALLIRALDKRKARLARLGVEIELCILPVVYDVIARRLRELDEAFKPDAILHFGVASRRKAFNVETQALNRVSALHHDATGASAGGHAVAPGAPFIMRATGPSRLIAAALRAARIKTRLSNNAGKYICNQTFYLSLIMNHAQAVSFIHTPQLASPRAPSRGDEAAHSRPTLDEAAQGAVAALRVIATKLRRDRIAKILTGESASAAKAEPG